MAKRHTQKGLRSSGILKGLFERETTSLGTKLLLAGEYPAVQEAIVQQFLKDWQTQLPVIQTPDERYSVHTGDGTMSVIDSTSSPKLLEMAYKIEIAAHCYALSRSRDPKISKADKELFKDDARTYFHEAVDLSYNVRVSQLPDAREQLLRHIAHIIKLHSYDVSCLPDLAELSRLANSVHGELYPGSPDLEEFNVLIRKITDRYQNDQNEKDQGNPTL